MPGPESGSVEPAPKQKANEKKAPELQQKSAPGQVQFLDDRLVANRLTSAEIAQKKAVADARKAALAEAANSGMAGLLRTMNAAAAKPDENPWVAALASSQTDSPAANAAEAAANVADNVAKAAANAAIGKPGENPSVAALASSQTNSSADKSATRPAVAKSKVKPRTSTGQSS